MNPTTNCGHGVGWDTAGRKIVAGSSIDEDQEHGLWKDIKTYVDVRYDDAVSS